MYRWLATIVLCLGVTRVGWAQTLSTEVFSSEEDLYEALVLGEITYRQYVVLQEILWQGVDSSNVHLLDEIPNLSSFLGKPHSLKTSLQQEQAAAFWSSSPQRTQGRFRVRYSWYQEINDPQQFRYRLSYRGDMSRQVTAAFKVHREKSGAERFVARSVRYRDADAFLKELIVGTFSRRLGLGTIFGYRGKLWDYSPRLDNESFLYPDYGGSNGWYADMRFSSWQIVSALSAHRDADFSLWSWGEMLRWRQSSFQPALIVGMNSLTNRTTEVRMRLLSTAFSFRYRYRSGFLSGELCRQEGDNRMGSAVVMEGRHRLPNAEVRYAGWSYSEDFVDLTAGSRSGILSYADTLSTVAFSYRSRRVHQTGGMVKAVIPVVPSWRVINSLVYASSRGQDTDVQFLFGVVKAVTPRFELRCDYLNKTRTRLPAATTRQVRGEMRFHTSMLVVRSSLAYISVREADDYLSWYLRVQYQLPKVGKFEFRTNMARYYFHPGAVRYWYGTVRSEQTLYNTLSLYLELHHRFNRLAATSHTLAVTVGVTTLL